MGSADPGHQVGVAEWHPVARVFFEVHRKEGRPPCLRVTYDCGVARRFNEFLCFEHGGYAQGVAETWWRCHGGQEPVPASAAEARVRAGDCDELLATAEVLVDPRYDQDFAEVVGFRLADGRGFARAAFLRKGAAR